MTHSREKDSTSGRPGYMRPASVKPSASSVERSKYNRTHYYKKKDYVIKLEAGTEELKRNNFHLEGKADLLTRQIYELRKFLNERSEENVRLYINLAAQTKSIQELGQEMTESSERHKKEMIESNERHKKEMDAVQEENLELKKKLNMLLAQMNGPNPSGGYSEVLSAPNGVTSNTMEPRAYTLDEIWNELDNPGCTLDEIWNELDNPELNNTA